MTETRVGWVPVGWFGDTTDEGPYCQACCPDHTSHVSPLDDDERHCTTCGADLRYPIGARVRIVDGPMVYRYRTDGVIVGKGGRIVGATDTTHLIGVKFPNNNDEIDRNRNPIPFPSSWLEVIDDPGNCL